MISYFFFPESVIKSESVIFNVFSYPIHFVLWLMDLHLRVSARQRVNLSVCFLFLEDRPLTHTDCQLYYSENNFELGTGHVWSEQFLVIFTFLNHDLEVDVNILSTGHIVSFLLLFQFLIFFHFFPPCDSFQLYLFDFVQRVCFFAHLEFIFQIKINNITCP